jgi:hypothetical protein
MTVRITKALALEAIRTEPLLASGTWAAPMRRSVANIQVGDEQACKVCAVGAVLRDVLDPTKSFHTINAVATRQTSGDSISGAGFTRELTLHVVQRLLKQGRVWNALSVLFEGFTSLLRNGDAEFKDEAAVRDAVCSFVEAEFPDDWELNMDPLLARPGVIKEVT